MNPNPSHPCAECGLPAPAGHAFCSDACHRRAGGRIMEIWRIEHEQRLIAESQQRIRASLHRIKMLSAGAVP